MHSDHLGSNSLLTNSSGVKVTGSETRYYPYGAQRLAPTAPADNITDRDFTGQKENSYIKLIYYNARWYDSQIGRFVSADSIVPQTDNPQAYNRYSYVYNNPIRYTDPSGHCVFAPPVDTFICVALLALVLTGDTPVDKPVDGGPRVHPVNAPGQYVCSSPLPDCFGETVYLKDFEEYDEDNPLPIEEFEAFADEVAEDLYTHDLTWPGFTSGRAEYDTPFYNNGQSERRSDGIPTELWPADQQVCIETIRCSGRSEINYIAQGMWSAASDEPKLAGEVLVYGWKLLEYGESPSSDVWFWYHYGYDYYQAWLEEQEQEQ